jgi:hypothetical protein
MESIHNYDKISGSCNEHNILFLLQNQQKWEDSFTCSLEDDNARVKNRDNSLD